MDLVASLKEKYPGAIAWAFGNSCEMADELELVAEEFQLIERL